MPGTTSVVAQKIGGLNMGGIPQDQSGEFFRRSGRVDRSREVSLSQDGQTPRVIQVGMGKQYGIQVAECEAIGDAVPLIGVRNPLEEAAVDQDLGLSHLHEVG